MRTQYAFQVKKVEKFNEFKNNINFVSNLEARVKEFENLPDIVFHNKYGLTTETDLTDFDLIHAYMNNRVASLASKKYKIFSLWHQKETINFLFR